MSKYKFKKDGFQIMLKAVDPKIANFIYQYLILKSKVSVTLFNTGYIAPSETAFGVWVDGQSKNTFCIYGDPAMDVLLHNVTTKLEKLLCLKLHETYSYSRLYKKGDVLEKHKDRFSCEISTTINLGGSSWPIYIETKKGKKVKVSLKPGDMLLYRGDILWHWRESLKGNQCGQVFLHYNNIKTKGSKENQYDRRPHLGLPAFYKKEIKND